MPYKDEAKSFNSIRRLAENERIASLYRRCKIVTTDRILIEIDNVRSKVDASTWMPDLVVAIDGSEISHQVDNGYPGAEIGYVTASAVLVNVKRLSIADMTRPINPTAFKKLQTAQSVDAGLPGANVILDDCEDAASSFRKALFEVLRGTSLEVGSETLLETYERLAAYRLDVTEANCPYGDVCGGEGTISAVFSGERSCQCGKPHYSTDLLRIHEGLREESGNQSVYTETMQVFERLLLVNILSALASNKELIKALHRVAFLVDGPLAVHGHPAWLSRSILLELRRLNELVIEATGSGLIIIGVEKSGLFVDHFRHVDLGTKEETSEIRKGEGAVQPGTVYLLTDSYIKQRIIYSDSPKPYGSQTYFGRKFFYKTKRSSLLTCSVPMFTVESENLKTAAPENFQRLEDTLATLETLWSSRYENALAPVIEAHAEATIPMNLGKALLKRLTKEMLDV